ncbi:unnamed protein product [Cuscuta europaea]|uniref:Uncharacterized protein n=1 Tax=Cuscuta europaea TaxID=41803 RepID=A0A9P0YNC1_CUSEU|nr:unnamed protein product [Cuscuta europaea]
MKIRRIFNRISAQQGLCSVGHLLLLLSFILSVVFLTTSHAACSNGTCQLLDSCSAPTDCGQGIYCGNCPAMGKNQPFCIRGQATIPTSIVSGLPFNKYSWLVTHNSFSIANAPLLTGGQRITFINQEDTVTNQLMNGVRGFMLDMYDFENDIWLCHSFHGQCFNFTAFEPAINTLREIEAFLSSNPSEIVTIIIEDYVHRPKGLTEVFNEAGLDRYLFPVSKMPRKGEDWPTVYEMASKNYRLLVFTSDSSKEREEGIAYQWRYMVENEPGDPGVRGSCTNRKESKGLNSKSASLFLMNYFPTIPDQNEACREHSTALVDTVSICHKAAGNLMPNFVAVNFYMRSDGGGVFDELDRMNGQSLCGCNTISACEAGGRYGVCKDIASSSRPPGINSNGGSFSGSVQMTGSAASTKLTNAIYVFLICWPLMIPFSL